MRKPHVRFPKSPAWMLSDIWSTCVRKRLFLGNVTKQFHCSVPYFSHFPFYDKWEIYDNRCYTIYDFFFKSAGRQIIERKTELYRICSRTVSARKELVRVNPRNFRLGWPLWLSYPYVGL